MEYVDCATSDEAASTATVDAVEAVSVATPATSVATSATASDASAKIFEDDTANGMKEVRSDGSITMFNDVKEFFCCFCWAICVGIVNAFEHSKPSM